MIENVQPDEHHWVAIKLSGGPKSPRDAVGATAYLTAKGIRQRADVISGGSYASCNDPRLYFGLVDATKVESMTIRWPSGVIEHLRIPAVDRIYVIQEGTGIIRATFDSYPLT